MGAYDATLDSLVDLNPHFSPNRRLSLGASVRGPLAPNPGDATK